MTSRTSDSTLSCSRFSERHAVPRRCATSGSLSGPSSTKITATMTRILMGLRLNIASVYDDHLNSPLQEADSRRWPDPQEDLADDVRARHAAPEATVARVRVIVAHDEVRVLGHDHVADRSLQRFDVRPILVQEMS